MTEKTYTLTINVTYNVEDDAQHLKIKARLDMLPQHLKIKARLDMLPLQLFASGEFYLGVPLVSFDHQVEDNPKLVKRMLDVSMVHVPEWYREPDVRMPYKLADHGFGFFCWVPYGDCADAPSFLVPFIELAHSKGCVYINFDNEGQVIEWLPTYDEEAKAPDAPVWIGPKHSPMAAITACNNEGEHVDPAHLANAAVEVLAAQRGGTFMVMDDFCAGMAQRTHFVTQLRDGGWFATYIAPKEG